jgi:diaminopimelate decarboxylase
MKPFIGRIGGRLHFEGIDIQELCEIQGTPLFLISESLLRDRFRRFRREFQKRYPNVAIAYSYKTNYLPSVCSILNKEGAWAEVVSLLELSIAEMIGVDPQRIIFNGPAKTNDGLLKAMELGIRVTNVDSISELKRIVSIVRDTGLRVNVGFRFSYPERPPSRNKFGITAEQILDGCRMISKEKRIHFTGLHTHIGTETTQIDKYEKAVELLTDLASSIYRRYGFQTEIIDLGGGFAFKEVPPYSHKGRWSPPSFSQYASQICSKLMHASADGLSQPPTLALEPGRALVGPTALLATKVIGTKQVSGIKWVITDAGLNLIPEAELNQHRVIPTVLRKGKPERVNVAGPLCFHEDVIRYGIEMPPIKEGDILAILDVGAYSISLSWQFIKLRGGVCLLCDGKYETIRRPETVEDVLRLDIIPSRPANNQKKSSRSALH